LVFTPKYRGQVFFGEVRERLMQVFREACLMRDWIVLGMEVMPDHAHIFVSVPPKWAPSDVAKILKGVSARRILKEFPGLRGGEG
ncbi:IS200/IS605 family transposase, partial [Acinetobacter baumannii]